jgi:hypothetical protein
MPFRASLLKWRWRRPSRLQLGASIVSRAAGATHWGRSSSDMWTGNSAVTTFPGVNRKHESRESLCVISR